MSTTKRTTFSIIAAFCLACCLAIAALAVAPSEAHAVNKPEKATIASVTPGVKKLTVKMEHQDVVGYQVKYSTSSTFKSAEKKTVATDGVTISLTKLKPAKKYYVKARAYRKKSNGDKVWGAWSTVKSATTYTYSITYKLNNGFWGSVTPKRGFNKSTPTFQLKAPSRAGYDFKGWYTTKTFKSGTKVTRIKKGTTKSKVLYAKWAKTPYYVDVKTGEYGYGAYVTYDKRSGSLVVPKTLKGANVVSFRCDEGYDVSKVDVSRCTELKKLDVSDCSLSTLDVTKNTKLKALYCSRNYLTSLNVTKCPQLVILECSKNSLKKLNISQNTKLEYLDASYNFMASMNISNCPKLNYVDLSYTDITALTPMLPGAAKKNFSNLQTLKLEACNRLTTLDCSGAGIQNLEICDCSVLTFLDCSQNSLASLKITGCPDLADLRCWENNLESLTLSCPSLIYINCQDNPYLKGFDVSNCPKMSSYSGADIMCDSGCTVTGCPESVIEHP